MNGIEINFSLTGILSFILYDNFGSVNGLDDHRSNTSRKRTNQEWLSIIVDKTIRGHKVRLYSDKLSYKKDL